MFGLILPPHRPRAGTGRVVYSPVLPLVSAYRIWKNGHQMTENQAANPAQGYHEYLGPALFEPLLEEVMACATPRPGERVLDVACGTGVLTRRAASEVGASGVVVGVDLNPMMVEVATAVGSPDGASIDYVQGDATSLDFPDRSFDSVYCQQGLQFFPDRAAGVGEMHRVLAEDGRAVVATWKPLDDLPLFAALTDAEDVHLKALGVGITRAELDAPFSLGDPEELEALLAEAGFQEVEVVDRTIEARFPDATRFVARMEFAYAAVIPQFAEDPSTFQAYLDAITEDTKDIVEQYRAGDEIVFPMHTNIAVTHKSP